MNQIKLTLLALTAFLFVNANAQFQEKSYSTSKGQIDALTISVDSNTKELSYQVLTQYVVEKNSTVTAGFTNLGEIFFSQVMLPTISLKPCDVYGLFDDQNKLFAMFFYVDGRFINSNNSLSEFKNIQAVCVDIKTRIAIELKTKEVANLKLKEKTLEASYSNITDAIKNLNKDSKSDLKTAGKEEKSAVKTAKKMENTNNEKATLDSEIAQKQAAVNAFPIDQLEKEIKEKNKVLKKNRKTLSKSAKSNKKDSEKLTLLNIEKKVNNEQAEAMKNNLPVLKKLNKENYKLIDKIQDLEADVKENEAKIAQSNAAVVSDSINVAVKEQAIFNFDLKGKQKELKKLNKASNKLGKKVDKQKGDISESTTEADTKRKEAEQAKMKSEELIKQQSDVKNELDEVKRKLKLLGE